MDVLCLSICMYARTLALGEAGGGKREEGQGLHFHSVLLTAHMQRRGWCECELAGWVSLALPCRSFVPGHVTELGSACSLACETGIVTCPTCRVCVSIRGVIGVKYKERCPATEILQ